MLGYKKITAPMYTDYFYTTAGNRYYYVSARINETVAINTPDLLSHKLVINTSTMTITFDNVDITFARFHSDCILNLFNNANCKIFSYKITDITDDSVILNLIPVLHNNIVCMKDLVSGNYYENSGTGDFIGGNPV